MEEKIMNAEEAFKRVLKTLKSNEVMTKKCEDGIYIRLADGDRKNGAFTLEWAKVFSYSEKERTKIIPKENL